MKQKNISKSKAYAIQTAVLCTIIMSFSQILWKIGSASLGTDIIKDILNEPLFAGFILYAICAVMMVVALRGEELSTIYPIFALSFVFVNILAAMILHESLNIYKWIGIIVIIFGITFIGFGSRKGDAAWQ